MIDPGTAFAVATTAFNAINKMVSAGKTIEETMSQIGQFYGAVSDFNEAKRAVENPPLFKKLVASESVDQEALNAYLAGKKIAKQEAELRNLLRFHYGESAYLELRQMRAKIKQQRENQIYKQAARRRALSANIIYLTLIAAGLAALYWLTAAIAAALS